jgi:hypothetical protein
MIKLPKKIEFIHEHDEPNISSPSVHFKRAYCDGFVLDVKKINDKYCSTFQLGDGSEPYFTGVAIFGASNEKDAIDAALDAAVRAKFVVRR